MSEIELLPCPFCGGPAHRITPMGEWRPGGYEPAGVRYVCADLYENPLRNCLGSMTFYGDNAEAEAIDAWNRRAVPLDELRAENARLREALATAALPLEALRMSGTDTLHVREVREAIDAGLVAIRAALGGPHA